MQSNQANPYIIKEAKWIRILLKELSEP